MSFRHPFQKLCTVSRADGQLLLFGASGPTINCILFSDGKLLYQWPSEYDATDDATDEDGGSSPHKRRRLDADGRSAVSRQQSEASDASIEIVAERKKGERRKTKIIDTKLPYVSHLLATSDSKYVIAVTAEDKCITVFKVNPSGSLSVKSQRCLPKKLCALKLTKDESTILAADKFGDVYSVPLHQSEGWKPKDKPQGDTEYKPSATDLTVHTKKNRLALQQQIERKQNNPRKEGPDFEHKLLLGHVSLLTDLAVGEAVVNGKRQEFILTSDRDEHIRVSRGIPQAHIIENFCMGHQEFVTKLCIPNFQPNLLIAGNGEASLKTFDWLSGRCLQKSRIGSEIETLFLVVAQKTGGPHRALPVAEGRIFNKLAVSGIWTITVPDEFIGTDSDKQHLILVAIEGIPTLLVYSIKPGDDTLSSPSAIGFDGNVLDVIVLSSTGQILVSIDNVHEPCSMKTYRQEPVEPETLFQVFQYLPSDPNESIRGIDYWKPIDHPFNSSALIEHLPHIEQQANDDSEKKQGQEKNFSVLGEFLYGLENLRKKRDVKDEEDEVQMDGEEFGVSGPEHWP